MGSTMSHINRTNVTDSFEYWPDLPADIQGRIANHFDPGVASRASLADKNLDRLCQGCACWSDLLRGSNRQGPLPERPRETVGVLATSYGRTRVKDAVVHVHRSGKPLDEDSFKDADFECWLLEQEQKARHSFYDPVADYAELFLSLRQNPDDFPANSYRRARAVKAHYEFFAHLKFARKELALDMARTRIEKELRDIKTTREPQNIPSTMPSEESKLNASRDIVDGNERLSDLFFEALGCRRA